MGKYTDHGLKGNLSPLTWLFPAATRKREFTILPEMYLRLGRDRFGGPKTRSVAMCSRWRTGQIVPRHWGFKPATKTNPYLLDVENAVLVDLEHLIRLSMVGSSES